MLRCSQVFQSENVRDYGDWQQEKLAFCHGGVGIGLILFELKGIQQGLSDQSWSEKIQGTSDSHIFFFFWLGGY